MENNLDILKIRTDTLDSSFFGKYQFNDSVSVSEKLQQIISKISSVEKDIPHLKFCSDGIVKLQPLILEKKYAIARTVDNVDNIILKRNEIQAYLNDLHCIDRLSELVGNDIFGGNDPVELQLKLTSIDQLLQTLRVESQQQSKELDEMLDLYEQSMTFVSDVCQSWEEKAKKLKI